MPALLIAFFALFGLPLLAQEATITIRLDQQSKALEIDRFAQGQGGLSDESIWGERVPEIRALHPRLIRLFIQEYFVAMPAADRYDWSKLDGTYRRHTEQKIAGTS